MGVKEKITASEYGGVRQLPDLSSPSFKHDWIVFVLVERSRRMFRPIRSILFPDTATVLLSFMRERLASYKENQQLKRGVKSNEIHI